MQRDFGDVRDIATRLPDHGYALMASGPSGETSQINRRIDDLEVKISNQVAIQTTANNALGVIAGELKANYDALAIKNSDWNSACTSWMTAKKCARTRDPIMVEINSLKAARTGIMNRKTAVTNDKNAAQSEIDNFQNELSSLLAEKAALAQATLTLAEQGTTPEQVRIEAEGKAAAFIEQKKAESAAASEKIASRERTRKIVIISSITMALLAIGFFAFRAIRAKKFKPA